MAKKSTAPAAPPDEASYKGHIAGSRKAKVHEAHDKQGADVAWTLGQKLGLAQGTLRSWFGVWRRQAGARPTPVEAKPVAVKANGKGKKQARPEPDKSAVTVATPAQEAR